MAWKQTHRLGFVAALLLGCGNPGPRNNGQLPPRITGVEAADPVLAGTMLRVTGVFFENLGPEPELVVRSDAGEFTLPITPHAEGEFLFAVSTELVEALGEGEASVEVAMTGPELRSGYFDATWNVAFTLPLSLTEAPTGEVHRNDAVVLRGAGFVSATEGTSHAQFQGTFTRDDGVGGTSTMDVRLAVTPLERTARDRGVVVLSTDLGGLWPGTFDGTITIVSTLLSGEARTSESLPTRLHFGLPEFYSLDPNLASVGQILSVRGAGFLGGPDRPTEVTIVRLQGAFTPQGGSETSFGPEELVPRVVSGTEARLVVEPEMTRRAVVSRAFRATRGVFVGTATPITISGADQVTGTAVPFQFTLGPLRQVVHVRFLPGFYDVLERFGLGSAAGSIEPLIVQRMEGIYEDYNVDIRLEEPEDFDPIAYAVVEIGGPDANGIGLFGYDNSPGKDIGNLRLGDHVGGANWEVLSDGSPGYGGVFVESFLWWSSHPDLPIERPASSPMPDPLFDELFDPVRQRPATLAEVMGEGDPNRVAEVRRALEALASIVGETTSHELGHSMGMAQPYGGADAFHNSSDGDGCLMDRGGDRPLTERTQQPSAARTRFCYDEPEYLERILSLE